MDLFTFFNPLSTCLQHGGVINTDTQDDVLGARRKWSIGRYPVCTKKAQCPVFEDHGVTGVKYQLTWLIYVFIAVETNAAVEILEMVSPQMLVRNHSNAHSTS